MSILLLLYLRVRTKKKEKKLSPRSVSSATNLASCTFPKAKEIAECEQD